MAHARLSGSQTKRWTICGGSTAYLEHHHRDEGGSTFYADQGTCAHALVERCLGDGSDPDNYLGRLIEIINPGEDNEGTSILKKGATMPEDPTRVVFEVDNDMIEATTHMVDYVRRRMVELDITPDQMRLECKFIPLPERNDTGGTADVTLDAWPHLLEVIDYKHGQGIFVPIDGNEQLRSYALGALNEFGFEDYETVKYTICQPRHTQAPFDGIMSEETTPGELAEWKVWLAGRAKIVDEAREFVHDGATLQELYDHGYLSTGKDGSHCTFCPLHTECPAAKARIEEMAEIDFANDPIEIEDGNVGPNRLAVLLPWIPFLDKWIKKVESDAEHHMLRGGKIDGFKVVRAKSNRKYKEDLEENDIVEILHGYGLNDEQIYKRSIITGPQAEKLVPKSERKRLEDDLMFKPEGRLTVAADDDKRDEVVINIEEDFDDL